MLFHDLRNFAKCYGGGGGGGEGGKRQREMREDKKQQQQNQRPFHGVTNYGRVRRKGTGKPGLERVKHSECLVMGGWGGGGEGGRDRLGGGGEGERYIITYEGNR